MEKLIAQRPCSFGGRNFFIGDEVPAALVIDPKYQESLGLLVIVNDGSGAEDASANETEKTKRKSARGGKAGAAGGN